VQVVRNDVRLDAEQPAIEVDSVLQMLESLHTVEVAYMLRDERAASARETKGVLRM